MWPRADPNESAGERDGQVWGKHYGDAIVPNLTNEHLLDPIVWSAVSAACFAAAESEAQRLRLKGRGEAYLAAWKNAATASFVTRTKTLAIMLRTNP